MATFKFGGTSALTLTEKITTPSIRLQKDGNNWYVPLFSGNKGSVVQNGDYNYTLGGLKVGNYHAAISREEADGFLIADNFYTFQNGVLSCTNSPTITKCNISKVGNFGLQSAFDKCTGLTGSVSFPNLTSIGNYGLQNAFYKCTGLTGSVSFPNLTSIGNYGLENAFYECTGLTGSISFPNLTSIGSKGLHSGFSECTGLTGSISFPNLTSIDNYGLQSAFYECTGLTGSISFPKLTSIGNYGLSGAFSRCTNIKQVHFKSSLSGNSQCTASYMGCTNATIYFDL